MSIATTLTAFAATLKNGTIMAWGSGESGKPGVRTCMHTSSVRLIYDSVS